MEYRSSQPDQVQAVLEDNSVTYDLREPPTRADVGLQEGQPVVAIDNAGGTPPIDVTVILRDGTNVELETSVINITAWSEDDTDVDPNSIELSRSFTSADDAAEYLLAFADVLQLDRSDIESWRTEAARMITDADAAANPSSFNQDFKGLRDGDLRVNAQATTFATRGRVGISVRFLWGSFWELAD